MIIGTLIGIAIYNSTSDLISPVLYKLLLGMDITEKDLAEQEPDLARTLANLRDYGPGLEEDLQLTFEIDEVISLAAIPRTNSASGAAEVCNQR